MACPSTSNRTRWNLSNDIQDEFIESAIKNPVVSVVRDIIQIYRYLDTIMVCTHRMIITNSLPKWGNFEICK